MTSFRTLLSLRATGALLGASILIAIGVMLGLRSLLDRELNASLVTVASIQASSVTDAPGGEMHFHEWELTAEEARSVTDLIRYSQIWDLGGESLLRSQFMQSDLPVDQTALRQAGAGELTWREHVYEGQRIRAVYYPLDRLGAIHGDHILQVAAPLGPRNDLLTRAAWLLALICGGVTVVAYAGSWWLAGRVVRPVYTIIDQAEEIGAGSLDRRIDAYADTSEYRRLVEVLNTMLSRIQASYNAQKRFAADASHELRSPLTALRGEIEVALRREREASHYRATLESALEEIDRLTGIAESLLAVARAEASAAEGGPWQSTVGPGGPERGMEKAELQRLVGSVAARIGVRNRTPVEVVGQVHGPAWIPVDPTAMSQVLWNLIENAARHSPPQGRVRVEIASTDGVTRVRVEDEGPGFGGEGDRVFERFYRRDPVRTPGGTEGGSGLGLSIVRALAEQQGGGVEAGDRAEGGGFVEVRFGGGGGATKG